MKTNTKEGEREDREQDNQALLRDLWVKISECMQHRMSQTAFEMWFNGAHCKSFKDNQCVISVNGDTNELWISENYMSDLQEAVNEVTNGGYQVVLESMAREDEVEGKPQSDLFADEPEGSFTDVDEESFEKKVRSAGLNSENNFKSFVVGRNSEFAHAACSAVATGSGISYNPLFMYGGSGLGKTHLMQAIGREMLRRKPDAKVQYLTTEQFTNDFINAVKKGSLERFRNKYRKADLLLIDDIQFLAGKERTQEEFFHTFNTLLDTKSQVVLSSDRPACEITQFESRMISRFESGLTVELQIPQVETRLAILRNKMEHWGTKLPEEVVEFIANSVRSNVRRLIGALVRVATYASLSNGEVTVEKAEHQLRDLLREEGAQKVTIDAIQKKVAEHFDIRIADMTSRRRPAHIAMARQVAMFLSRELTQYSLVEIGDAFGGRDHGTVIHAVKKVTQQMEAEHSVRSTVELLSATLRRC